jgi:hypothetical protein
VAIPATGPCPPGRRPSPIMAELDARALNWRFVVPDEPRGLLLLPAGGERMEDAVSPELSASALSAALGDGPYPAVAAPDLAGWAGLERAGGAAGLLARLGDSVGPGGWLFAGFPNAWYPAHPAAPGSLGLGAARRILRRSGLGIDEAYLALPDQRCPAYLVSTGGPAELEYFLRRLFRPYPGSLSGWRAGLRQRSLSIMRMVALGLPHRLRVRFAPALGIVARRRP